MDGTAVTSVTCGEQHTVFLTKDGKMWSVGSNMDGQLGRGSRTEGSFSIYPVSWTSSAKIIQVTLSFFFGENPLENDFTIFFR